MRQRVVGAIGISSAPSVIIADEPTTSLDVTIQAAYLRLLRQIQEEQGVAIIFITHDFGMLAKMCDRVAVMYAGRIVEMADVRTIFNRPLHEYTKALIYSVPKLEGTRSGCRSWTVSRRYCTTFRRATPSRRALRCSSAPEDALIRPELVEVEPGHWVQLGRARSPTSTGTPTSSTMDERVDRPMTQLGIAAQQRPFRSAPGIDPGADAIIQVRNLRKWYRLGAASLGFGETSYLKAVDDVSFDIERGRTFGLVGESGCGKTTTLKMLLQLERPTAGQIYFEGEEVATHVGGRPQGVPALGAGRVPGPLGLAQSAHAGRATSSASRSRSPRRWPEPDQVAGRRAAYRGRPQPVSGEPLSARVLGRPAPAHRHCPCALRSSPR